MVAKAEDLALKQPSARFSVGGMGAGGEQCEGGGAGVLGPRGGKSVGRKIGAQRTTRLTCLTT